MRPPTNASAWISADGQREQHRDARAERAAGGDAEDVGRDQRILEQALVGGAGGGECRADGERARHARRAHLQHDGLDVATRARSRRR